MNDYRIKIVAIASVLLIFASLGVQSFGHIGDAGAPCNYSAPDHEAGRSELSVISSSEEECPACLLMLQARSLGPPLFVSTEPPPVGGPVLMSRSPGIVILRTSSTVARAPPVL